MDSDRPLDEGSGVREVSLQLERRIDLSYTITVDRTPLAALVAALRRDPLGHRYAVVTDDTVAGLYADAVESSLRACSLTVDRFDFPAGEVHKTRATKESLEDAMLSAGLGRDCAVIALGGGVVGDLAGYLAATYLRGVPFVQVPTTLVAMADSSVGGKTGLDVPAGKNLIGAFHQPRGVFMGVDWLRSLPPRQFAAGMAEVVKHGAIADAEFFAFLEQRSEAIRAQDSDTLIEMLARSCRIKADVVQEDEREGDRRKILNFGHTLGHAIERATDYAVLHGEAVAIGCAVAAELSVRGCGLAPDEARRIVALMERYDLPVRVPSHLTTTELLAAAASDKKARRGVTQYVLLERIGRMHRGETGYGIPRADAEVAAAIEACR